MLDKETIKRLLDLAKEARDHAYAPYSHFPVGAALMAEGGDIFQGCNVENAAFGSTICAEQTAVVKGISEGNKKFIAIAIAGPDDTRLCNPCGNCRQILSEFGIDMAIFTMLNGEIQYTTLQELLPGSFGKQHLGKAE